MRWTQPHGSCLVTFSQWSFEINLTRNAMLWYHTKKSQDRSVLQFEGKPVDNQTLSSVATYFAVYMVCIFATFLVVCFEPFDFETNFTAAVAAFNNVGPGFGTVGPAGSFADYSAFSKLIFSFAMLLGRLEIFPLVIALSPSTWKTKRWWFALCFGTKHRYKSLWDFRYTPLAFDIPSVRYAFGIRQKRERLTI